MLITSGPRISWETMQKWSPAIPTFRAVQDHVEANMNPFRRYKNHTSPDDEQDVIQLVAYYTEHKIFSTKPDRVGQLKEEDRFHNTVKAGVKKVLKGTYIDEWWQNRDRDWNQDQNWEVAPTSDEDSS
jgi:hypothetical protein